MSEPILTQAEQERQTLYAAIEDARACSRELGAEVDRLRKGIQDYLDGNYEGPPVRKVDQCPHGRFQWEACDQCIDAHFRKVLDRSVIPAGAHKEER